MSVRSKVAELLALQDSVSESAVSIDKFTDEEAVRGIGMGSGLEDVWDHFKLGKTGTEIRHAQR